MLQFNSVLVFCAILINRTAAIMNEMSINIDDILNEKLMPTSIFLIEGPKFTDNSSSSQIYSNITGVVGNFQNAYNTMQFHRQMINRYMYSNFVANQILNQIAPVKLEDRIGVVNGVKDMSAGIKNSRVPRNGISDIMLYDQGSRAYQDWLTKTSTLDDIYQHINSNGSTSGGTKNPPFRRIDGSNSNDESEYEEGTVTGYAVQHPVPSGFVRRPANHLNENENQESLLQQSIAGNKAVSPADYLYYPNPNQILLNQPYLAYDYPQNYLPFLINNVNNNKINDNKNESKKWKPFIHVREKIKNFFFGQTNNDSMNQNPGYSNYEQGHGYDDYGVSYDSGAGASSKELTLKNIYDIALTAIAFLTFGVFVLQVIMCITVTKTSANMMMMPMEMEEMGMDGGDEVTEMRRKKRSIPVSRLSEINEVARKVLQSIEASLVAEKDDGKCLQKILCENNKYARNRNDNQKMWMPIWGLGMSWLSSRLINKPDSSGAILQCLKASAIGLGDGNCDNTFSCDLNLIQNARKLRRRKRSTNNYVFKWNI